MTPLLPEAAPCKAVLVAWCACVVGFSSAILRVDASAASEDTRRSLVQFIDSRDNRVTDSGLQIAATAPAAQATLDLSGEWEIQEEERTYRATLDRDGNGPYTWQGGRITTTRLLDRTWEGTWQQPGNDREGAFEILLSDDGMEAKGVWWYTRVGDRTHIPPKQWGGSYLWKRLSSTPSPSSTR